mgnify:CR=1 FL=1|jgi:mono/diheme cytochrome c family protein
MQHRFLMSLCTAAALAGGFSMSASAEDAPLYTVVEGSQVDAKTYGGFKAWRAANCAQCHGANQEGAVGPALTESLKVMTKAEFVTTITEGRLAKGMPNWSANPTVMNNMDGLYAYLKGRSEGKITIARVTQIPQ